MFQTRANSWAFLSLLEIAERGGKGVVRVSVISSKNGLPTTYTAKVMGELAKARICRSDRGPQGGFQLARAPKDISPWRFSRPLTVRWPAGTFFRTAYPVIISAA